MPFPVPALVVTKPSLDQCQMETAAHELTIPRAKLKHCSWLSGQGLQYGPVEGSGHVIVPSTV